MENLVERTYKKLKNTNTPGKDLVTFYRYLFNAEWSVDLIKQFNRLVKVYGRERVFFALIDIHDSFKAKGKEISKENPYPLIVYFIKSTFKKDHAGELDIYKYSLKSYVDEYKKHLKRKMEVEVPEDFEDEL